MDRKRKAALCCLLAAIIKIEQERKMMEEKTPRKHPQVEKKVAKKASESSSQNEEQMVITPDLSLVKEETITDDDRIHNIQMNTELIKRTIASLEKRKDEYTSFGEFVAHELRCINATSLRQKLKRMIQQAILEIAEEDENCTD